MKARRVKLIGVAALACLVAGAVAPQTASARIRRNDCFYSAEGVRGRQMGERNATNLFRRIWTRLNRSCDQLDRLVNIIADTPLAPPTSRGAFQACFYLGYTETLFNELDATAMRCEDACFNAGADIGQISAQGYCAASAALGGLDDPGFISQPELKVCGFNVVIGCKSQYVQTAVFDIASCRPFTEGYFEQIFDNTVRQDCYVPSDVPIRDHGRMFALSSFLDE